MSASAPPGGLRVNELSKFTELRAWYEVALNCAAPFCAVCQVPFQGMDIVRVLFACSHALHSRCGDLWLCERGSCALCGVGVTTCTGSPASAETAATPVGSGCSTPVPRPFRAASPASSIYSGMSSSMSGSPMAATPPHSFEHLIRNQWAMLGGDQSDGNIGALLMSMQGQLAALQQQAQQLMTQLQGVTMLVMQKDNLMRNPSPRLSNVFNRRLSSGSSSPSSTPPLAHPVPLRTAPPPWLTPEPQRPLIISGFDSVRPVTFSAPEGVAGTPSFGPPRKATPISPGTVTKNCFPSEDDSCEN